MGHQRATSIVTPLSVVLMVFSGLFASIAAIQSIVAWMVFPIGFVGDLDADASPTALKVVLEYFPVVTTLLACFWGFVFWIASSLRKRQEWARRMLVLLTAIGAVLIIGLIFLFWAIPPADLATDAAAASSVRLSGTIVGASFLFALWWLARRLSMPSIRTEFEDQRAAPES